MPVEIRVPTLGESVVEATITRWLKHEGDAIAIGDALVELETDKVNLEVPAEEDGILQTITEHEGQTVRVGSILGLLSGKGDSVQPAPKAVLTNSEVQSPQGDSSTSNSGKNGDRVNMPATPIARRLAEDNQINLSKITGTGPGGRVTKEDVTNYVAMAPTKLGADSPLLSESPSPLPVTLPSTSSVKPPSSTFSDNGRMEIRSKMSRRRITIASRLVDAQRTAAMLTTFNEVDMTAVMDLRSRRKESFKERFGVGLGFMSFFTKATVGALKAYPMLNAEIQGDEIVKKTYFDIGVAVSTEEGLVVPVVRDADRLTFAYIESQIAELAKRARENKLTLPELTGGTFTITNGGTFGSLMSTPILNTPQVGILGMHKIQDRAVVIKGEIVIRSMMYLALSYDHRIVDGSEAVRFLVKIKELIEDPETLLIEA